MSNEINRIKQLVGDDLIVSAVELPANHHKKNELVLDLEEALANFDDDANYAHFVVRVKRSTKDFILTAQADSVTAETKDEFSISTLVNETLHIGQQIAEKRERAQIEKTEALDPTFLLENAKILEENGDFQLARNIYKSIIRNGKHVSLCLAGVARTFVGENKIKEALKCYEEAIAYSPDVQHYQALTGLLIQSGRDEEASEVLARVLSIEGLNDVQKFDFHKSLGNCFTRLNNHSKAEEHYLSAYELNADSDVLQVNVGTLAMKKNDLDAAKKHFERALDLNMKNDKAMSGLGMIALLKGSLKQAHDLFIRALNCNPDNLSTIFNLVKTAYELKYFRDAAYFLRNYISNNSADVNILYSYAGVLYHQEEHALAKAQVEKILSLNPNHMGAKELAELLAQR